jgi:MFS family permease
MGRHFDKNLQYYKFCLYGLFKNLRFFEAFLILFFLENGLSYLEIGFLYTIREIIIAIIEIPSGFIADAFGRRKTLVSSFLIYALSFVGFSFSDNFFLFAVSMSVFAFADAFRTGVHKAMIFNYLKVNNWEDQKVDYYGHTRSWSQAGSAISAAMAALIVFVTGSYQTIFLVALIPYLLDAFLVWSYPVYLDGEKTAFSAGSIVKAFKDVLEAFVQSLRNTAMLRSLFSLSLYTGYYKSVKDYVQPLIKTMALAIPCLTYLNNQKKTAVIIAVFYFTAYVLTAIASKNSAKFNAWFRNSYRAMNISMLAGLSIGLVVGISFMNGFYIIAIVGFVFILLVENVRKPIGISLIAADTNEKAMATILSVQSQAKSVLTAMIAPLLGWFADMYSPGTSLLLVSVIIVVLALIFRPAT